jgi:hypothetical protein
MEPLVVYAITQPCLPPFQAQTVALIRLAGQRRSKADLRRA